MHVTRHELWNDARSNFDNFLSECFRYIPFGYVYQYVPFFSIPFFAMFSNLRYRVWHEWILSLWRISQFIPPGQNGLHLNDPCHIWPCLAFLIPHLYLVWPVFLHTLFLFSLCDLELAQFRGTRKRNGIVTNTKGEKIERSKSDESVKGAVHPITLIILHDRLILA